MLGAIVSANYAFRWEISLRGRPFLVDGNERNVNVSLALLDLTTPDATVGVFWAGSIPYFTERVAHDCLGKSDKYIARLAPDTSGNVAWDGMTSVPGHNKYDLNYSLKKLRPTYVQYVKWGSHDLSEWASQAYVLVNYKGTEFLLLRGSKDVHWDKVARLSAAHVY